MYLVHKRQRKNPEENTSKCVSATCGKYHTTWRAGGEGARPEIKRPLDNHLVGEDEHLDPAGRPWGTAGEREGAAGVMGPQGSWTLGGQAREHREQRLVQTSRPG